MPIDTWVLLDLHKLLWNKFGHPEKKRLPLKGDQDADFIARRGYWLGTVFDLRCVTSFVRSKEQDKIFILVCL